MRVVEHTAADGTHASVLMVGSELEIYHANSQTRFLLMSNHAVWRGELEATFGAHVNFAIAFDDFNADQFVVDGSQGWRDFLLDGILMTRSTSRHWSGR